MMAQDVPSEAGTDTEAGESRRLDCNHLVVDVVTLEAFLAALRENKPPNDRLLTLIRTPPPWIE